MHASKRRANRRDASLPTVCVEIATCESGRQRSKGSENWRIATGNATRANGCASAVSATSRSGLANEPTSSAGQIRGREFRANSIADASRMLNGLTVQASSLAKHANDPCWNGATWVGFR